MKDISLKTNAMLNSHIKLVFMAGCIIALFLASSHVFAADLLAGTDADIKDTIAKTGKNWILIIDGIAAGLMFSTRKNPVILGSVFALAIFINVLIFMTKGTV